MWIPGILVTGKEVATKEREPMIFVSFEDEHAIFETVLFPDAFRRYFPMLDDGWAFLVHGRVDEDFGALSIGVERLVKVSRDSGAAAGDAAAPHPAGGAAGRARSRCALRAGAASAPRPPTWWRPTAPPCSRGGAGTGAMAMAKRGRAGGGLDAERLGLAAGS